MRIRHAAVASLVLGGFALTCTATASYWQTFIFVRRGAVLGWLEALGLVREPKNEAFNSVSSPGLLSLYDEKALAVLHLCGAVTGLAAIILALVAERQEESSLYLGAGVICGAGALLLWNTLAAFIGLAIAGVGIAALRHIRQA